MNQLVKIYSNLYKEYGPQGWWPLLDLGEVTYKPGDRHYGGYHPGDYSYPKTARQRFEICIGAVLTQSVGWISVVKALVNLKKLKAINPNAILELDDSILKEAIKPVGYYNQKLRKIRGFTRYFISLNNKIPRREDLLDLWGIGPETADSMRLYAFKVPTFVVDAYTRRIFTNLGIVKPKATYDEIKALFEGNLKPDLKIYQEYHALIVEHAKQYHTRVKDRNECPICIQARKLLSTE